MSAHSLEDRVARLCACKPDDLRVRTRKPLDHQSNRLYDGWIGKRRLIIKEYLKSDELEDAPRREHAALTRLRDLDIAPAPVGIDPAPPPLVVYEYLEGEMWDRRVPSRGELEQLADLWLRLHDLPTEGLWPSRGYDHDEAAFMGWLEKVFASYRHWAEAAFPPGIQALALCQEATERCRGIAPELASLPSVDVFGRSDNRFANVIARPDGRLGFVDWEDSGLRDPARDLADLACHANQEDLLTPADVDAFMRRYLEGRGAADPTLERRTHLLMAAFPLFWLVGMLGGGLRRAATGRLDGWRANELPANLRLRRYLARVLAWPDRDLTPQLERIAEVRFFPV